ALRTLTRARRDLIQSRTATRQRLHDELVTLFPEFVGFLSTLPRRAHQETHHGSRAHLRASVGPAWTTARLTPPEEASDPLAPDIEIGQPQNHAPDLAGAVLGEPEVAIRPDGQTKRPALAVRQGELGEGAAWGDTPDLAGTGLGEPEVAIRPGDDTKGPA